MAETMLAGGDFMCDLDFQREDTAGAPLRAVPQIPAATTFIGCAKRFDDTVSRAIEEAVGELVRRGFALLPEARRKKLTAARPTVDLGPTDVEVYGVQKEGMAFNYKGQRCGRPVMRADSGFFDKKVAEAALLHGADFAIAARRNRAVWRAERVIPDQAWRPAINMDAEVAECSYVPGAWPEGTRSTCRRVRVAREDLRMPRRYTTTYWPWATGLPGCAKASRSPCA
jgi:hypothetical protein